jgi:hypothetical protein
VSEKKRDEACAGYEFESRSPARALPPCAHYRHK